MPVSVLLGTETHQLSHIYNHQRCRIYFAAENIIKIIYCIENVIKSDKKVEARYL